MIETGYGDAAARPAPDDVDVRRLTTGQLRMLGLARIAYLTAWQPDGGLAGYSIHDADGTVVAAFDELDLVRELVDRLGLTLVPVH
jgi:hypothetical protein